MAPRPTLTIEPTPAKAGRPVLLHLRRHRRHQPLPLRGGGRRPARWPDAERRRRARRHRLHHRHLDVHRARRRRQRRERRPAVDLPCRVSPTSPWSRRRRDVHDRRQHRHLHRHRHQQRRPRTYDGVRIEDPLAGVLDDAVYNGDAVATRGALGYAAATLAWTLDLPAGTTVTLTYSVTVAAPVTGDDLLGGTVVTAGASTNCNPGYADSRCSTTVRVAGLRLTASADVVTHDPRRPGAPPVRRCQHRTDHLHRPRRQSWTPAAQPTTRRSPIPKPVRAWSAPTPTAPRPGPSPSHQGRGRWRRPRPPSRTRRPVTGPWSARSPPVRRAAPAPPATIPGARSPSRCCCLSSH